MAQEENFSKDIPVINRCLAAIAKNIEKLQSVGVPSYFAYCLPPAGTIFTRGTWKTMDNVIKSAIGCTDHTEFSKQVQEDLKKLKSKTVPVKQQEPVPILGALPDATKASRDELRPILTEMVRIDQSKGKVIV